MRNAIALLITLLFIIAITVAVGVSLSQFKHAHRTISDNKFLAQSSVIVEDVLNALHKSSKLKEITDTKSLDTFLQDNHHTLLEADGLRIDIGITSARGKLNINTLSKSEVFQERFSLYLRRYYVSDISYLNDLLIDCMSGEQNVYRTEIMDRIPWMYHEQIVSMIHLEQILDFYVQTRHDNSVHTVPWEQLFHFSSAKEGEIDANYVTAETWKLMLPDITPEGAKRLAEQTAPYEDKSSLGLSSAELESLAAFNMRFYTPVLHVDISLSQDERQSNMAFEYEITTNQTKVLNYAI